jgi:deazaflavin-dependent oxidoreductase (nitroreductase family)
MPPPYLIIVGVIPVDFFAAIIASKLTRIESFPVDFRKAYPRLCEGVKAAARSLSRPDHNRIFTAMNLKDETNVVADLTTIGRKTGKRRTVELRFLYRNGKLYATSSKVQGKHWCQNMIKNPAVEITVKGEKLSCTATRVTDEALRKRILSLRDSPPRLDRVVFEITPNN